MLPEKVARLLWNRSVEYAEQAILYYHYPDFSPTDPKYLNAEVYLVVKLTTLLARFTNNHYCDLFETIMPTLQPGQNLPQVLEQHKPLYDVLEKDVQELCGVLFSWLKPDVYKAFDSLFGKFEPIQSHQMKDTYLMSLRAEFPLADAEFIEIAAETDRRWWQFLHEESDQSRREKLQRLYRNAVSAAARQEEESVIAAEKLIKVVENPPKSFHPKPKGFGSDETKASRRDRN